MIRVLFYRLLEVTRLVVKHFLCFWDFLVFLIHGVVTTWLGLEILSFLVCLFPLLIGTKFFIFSMSNVNATYARFTKYKMFKKISQKFALGSFYLCTFDTVLHFNTYSLFWLSRFDKDNKKGALNGYFLWMVIGYGIGKLFCSVLVLIYILSSEWGCLLFFPPVHLRPSISWFYSLICWLELVIVNVFLL
jgi:hypothetical protein